MHSEESRKNLPDSNSVQLHFNAFGWCIKHEVYDCLYGRHKYTRSGICMQLCVFLNQIYISGLCWMANFHGQLQSKQKIVFSSLFAKWCSYFFRFGGFGGFCLIWQTEGAQRNNFYRLRWPICTRKGPGQAMPDQIKKKHLQWTVNAGTNVRALRWTWILYFCNEMWQVQGLEPFPSDLSKGRPGN